MVLQNGYSDMLKAPEISESLTTPTAHNMFGQESSHTKHVELRWHWVRDLTNDGLINIVDCRDPQQTADILTKQIPRPKFSRHVNELGSSDVSV